MAFFLISDSSLDIREYQLMKVKNLVLEVPSVLFKPELVFDIEFCRKVGSDSDFNQGEGKIPGGGYKIFRPAQPKSWVGRVLPSPPPLVEPLIIQL